MGDKCVVFFVGGMGTAQVKPKNSPGCDAHVLCMGGAAKKSGDQIARNQKRGHLALMPVDWVQFTA